MQQDTYIAKNLKTWNALFAQHWVRENILGESGEGVLAKKVVFSKENEKELAEDIVEARRIKDSRYLHREEARYKDTRATEGRRITNEVKLSLYRLLILLGQEVILNKFRTISAPF